MDFSNLEVLANQRLIGILVEAESTEQFARTRMVAGRLVFSCWSYPNCYPLMSCASTIASCGTNATDAAPNAYFNGQNHTSRDDQ